MTNNSPKHIAFKTLIKHKHYLLNNCTDLKRIIEYNQFSVIEYKKHANAEPVSELIKRLRIESEIEQNDCFLYVKNNLKLVFLHADISDEDKCSLLRHELGHICDPDLKNSEISYSKIKKEEFANEFSCYVKNPDISIKLKLFIIKKWKLIIGMITLIACVLWLYFMIKSLIIQPEKPVTDDILTAKLSDNGYYVTSSGKKYHRKRCIIIKYKFNLTQVTINEAVDAGYKPCLICIPKEE